MSTDSATAIERVDCEVFSVPTGEPEADGTLTWDHTGVVVVRVAAGGEEGLGFTYGPPACATVVRSDLADVVSGRDPMDLPGAWEAMVRHIRNQGRPGVVSMAISAVDIALWDLKAKLLGMPLASLIGRVRDAVPVYGSGGFTSMDDDELRHQLGRWVRDAGVGAVKIKIGESWGTQAQRDLDRVLVARDTIGAHTELFVDANGGYTRGQAERMAALLADLGVSWFEEPVSSDDLAGLAAVRAHTVIDVAAGEYGYHLAYFAHMVNSGAVDVIQADVTRCGGISEWLRVAALAHANGLDISGHCAPALHIAPACAAPNARHLEYFADHERIEGLLFDGVPEPHGGTLAPDLAATGHGMSLAADRAGEFRSESP